MNHIILSTINARYSHASFGLRCLYANLKELKDNAVIREFTLQNRPEDIVEELTNDSPSIIAFGIYIWNIELFKTVIPLLKRTHPQIIIVVGGPEISFEYENSPIFPFVDHIIKGEGEITLYQTLQALTEGKTPKKVIDEIKPNLAEIETPYQYYTDHDIQSRNISVELSRGCPFGCEFCISSLDSKVREFPLDRFLEDISNLWERGVRKFKFIDRTFNLKYETCETVLNFFLARSEPYFLHFEMVPDRLPDRLKELVKKFPKGSLQFEIGIQSFNPEVSKEIGRNQNYKLIAKNLNFLKDETTVHVHADLIIGLPGEDLGSIGRGIDTLYSLTDQEIQIGILKRLPGAPIDRHTQNHKIIYSEVAPYEIMKSELLSYKDMMRLKRFARYWDLVINNGNFKRAQQQITSDSPFNNFLHFSDWLYSVSNQTHQISLEKLAIFIATYLIEQKGLSKEIVHQLVEEDYMATPGRKLPKFLNPKYQDQEKTKNSTGIARQQRH